MRRVANVVRIADGGLVQHHGLLILLHHLVNHFLRYVEKRVVILVRKLGLLLIRGPCQVVTVPPPYVVQRLDVILVQDIELHPMVRPASNEGLRRRAMVEVALLRTFATCSTRYRIRPCRRAPARRTNRGGIADVTNSTVTIRRAALLVPPVLPAARPTRRNARRRHRWRWARTIWRLLLGRLAVELMSACPRLRAAPPMAVPPLTAAAATNTRLDEPRNSGRHRITLLRVAQCRCHRKNPTGKG
mmetsp:Transcript_41221/g.103520  ORF Transcript_41221/g.103520 Transcript_41221/m.103520 type:complete len:245 (+) Transcript_41221:2236-2970(+)